MNKSNKKMVMNCHLAIEQVRKSGKRYDNYVLTLEDGTSFKVNVLPFYPRSLKGRIYHVLKGGKSHENK